MINELLLGLLVGYVAATLSESLLHRGFGHASFRMRKRFARIPWLHRWISQFHFGHSVVHHAKTYRSDHVTQFYDAQEQQALDAHLTARNMEVFIRTRYGLVTNFLGSLYFIIPPTLCCLLIGFVIWKRIEWPFLVASMLPILSVPCLSCFVHPFLHQSLPETKKKAPWPIRMLLRTPYGRWMRIAHFVHHRHARYNFNLLPGGDLLLGCYRRPSLDEWEEMRAMKLID